MQKKPEERKSSEIKNRTRNNIPIISLNEYGSVNYTSDDGTNLEIKAFCTQRYDVTFDMFAKIDVNGETACGLYKHLTALDTPPKGAGKVSWNFEKFVIGKDGKVVARFEPRTKPDAPEVLKAIESALAK